ncbi:hypothetical protein [Solitalea longa]|uniref:hypothetical protein n=1 Tax=Solitalea longa TaxID=2079460 RepID=UPI0010571F01|nr:hypothetical protein [Solitalea longa]
MRQFIAIILTIGLFSCNHGKTEDTSTNSKSDNFDFLETLYHQCDTIIESADTLMIVNSKLDTTIIETGIFTFLQHDYPLTTPHNLIDLSKTAIQYDKLGQKEKAGKFYKNIVDFYLNERPKQLKGFSDMNRYLQYEVNSAILCSYAYEKLKDKENAIMILQPFLANVEAWNSKIHDRYIELCIGKFGIDKVRTELNSCGKTVQLKKQNAPEMEDWVVNVFGADIGVGNSFNSEVISSPRADSLIKEMDFYKLAQ